FVFNMSFNGWDGGWAVFPRYLGPAVPFLSLPMVFGFIRFLKLASALAAWSIISALLIVAVDPQSFVGPGLAIRDKPFWQHNPLWQYEWPLFATNRAWPFFRELE